MSTKKNAEDVKTVSAPVASAAKKNNMGGFSLSSFTSSAQKGCQEAVSFVFVLFFFLTSEISAWQKSPAKKVVIQFSFFQTDFEYVLSSIDCSVLKHFEEKK